MLAGVKEFVENHGRSLADKRFEKQVGKKIVDAEPFAGVAI